MGEKVQYFCKIVRREAICQFDSLYSEMESTTPITMEYFIKGLYLYSPPVNYQSKRKRAMRRGMRKLRGLKVRHYADFLIDLNEYLTSLPGDTLSGKIEVTELSKMLSDNMPNSWSKQVYVNGFDCEYNGDFGIYL